MDGVEKPPQAPIAIELPREGQPPLVVADRTEQSRQEVLAYLRERTAEQRQQLLNGIKKAREGAVDDHSTHAWLQAIVEASLRERAEETHLTAERLQDLRGAANNLLSPEAAWNYTTGQVADLTSGRASVESVGATVGGGLGAVLGVSWLVTRFTRIFESNDGRDPGDRVTMLDRAGRFLKFLLWTAGVGTGAVAAANLWRMAFHPASREQMASKSPDTPAQQESMKSMAEQLQRLPTGELFARSSSDTFTVDGHTYNLGGNSLTIDGRALVMRSSFFSLPILSVAHDGTGNFSLVVEQPWIVGGGPSKPATIRISDLASYLPRIARGDKPTYTVIDPQSKKQHVITFSLA